MIAKYTWTELEWMWEQKKLTPEEAVESLIQWGQHAHGVAVLCEHRMAIQESEIQTLMQANIRWGVRVEELEQQVAKIMERMTKLEKRGTDGVE